MEISALKSYARKPQAGEFPAGELDGVVQHLPVEWDKAAFTARFMASLYDEVKQGQAAALAQIRALDDELKAAGKGKAAEEKAAELRGRVLHLRAEIEEIEQRVYARALAENILLSWGFTSGGEPVPVSFEFLMAQTREFAADLFAFCRRESLPKVAEKKTGSPTSENLTTPATSPSSSPRTRSTRPRKGPRSSDTRRSSPSPDASASPSQN